MRAGGRCPARRVRRVAVLLTAGLVAAGTIATVSVARAETPRLTLEQAVTPSARFVKDGQAVKFALYGFIEFENLDELFGYIDSQVGRWQFTSAAAGREFAQALVRKGVESRLISMIYEPPLEILKTYTAQELSAAVEKLPPEGDPLIFKGRYWQLTRNDYRDVMLQIQARWKTSLNCWSAAPSIPARVLSNWYVIAEGIELYGARYDSTEHFWQAVKYHPAVQVADVLDLLRQFLAIDWSRWLGRFDRDQEVYLAHTYAIEFLRANLSRTKLAWFETEVRNRVTESRVAARSIQQRDPRASGPRFSAFDEKVLWGDLADVFHLVYFFATLEGGRLRSDDLGPIVEALVANHFDGIYLAAGAARIGFISPEFQRLMLEIWKVKFLKMPRFAEVIRSTAGVKLDHFLNDGDSPDIPIPVYVDYLNQIRTLAIQQAQRPLRP